MDACQRLSAFLEWRGWTQATAAQHFGCTQTYVSMLVRGERVPGRRVSGAIARETAEWPEGVIAPDAWDTVGLADTGTEG